LKHQAHAYCSHYRAGSRVRGAIHANVRAAPGAFASAAYSRRATRECQKCRRQSATESLVKSPRCRRMVQHVEHRLGRCAWLPSPALMIATVRAHMAGNKVRGSRIPCRTRTCRQPIRVQVAAGCVTAFHPCWSEEVLDIQVLSTSARQALRRQPKVVRVRVEFLEENTLTYRLRVKQRGLSAARSPLREKESAVVQAGSVRAGSRDRPSMVRKLAAVTLKN